LYAWCALDTLFLPAYLGKPARVTSTCPATNTLISLTVTPDGVETCDPPQTVLSVITTQHCTSGLEGTFCGQVYFFASDEAARHWIGERSNFAILTLAEAYQLAQKVYIEQMRSYT
jgi:alkylmercury lyase